MINKEHVIAVYGLSSSTQVLLKRLGDEFNIIGLLDGYRQEGTLYGKPIISMEQAIKSKVTAIIIVARPGSRRIIVNRIREVCTEHNIKLFDEHGNDLLEPISEHENFCVESGIKKEELLEKIEQYEVISFDIFDTLITRAVLYPADVFELVEHKIIAKYGQGFRFCEKRQEVERTLSRNGVPKIDDIYGELKGQIALSESELKEIQELEWQTEQQLMLPRYDMCQIFQYALEKQKRVYLVSDMYYSEVQLESMLRKLGIVGYEKLLVSCECGTTKGQQLFQVLKEEAKAESYLHIGDNYLADVKSAECNGIVGVWIKSGIELFEAVGWSERFVGCDSLADRVKQGMFVARMFNSPFVLSESGFGIEEPGDLGYLLLAPILTEYCIWLYNKLIEMQETTILFCSRDGYLLKQLMDKLLSRYQQKNMSMETIYFLTSRISAVGAGLCKEQDVMRLAELNFSGSFKQMLQTRFSLTDEEIGEADCDENTSSEEVLKYKDIILERALENRERYLQYIANLGLAGKEVAIFDFVSSGTCQAALEKIMGQKMHGYYFIRVEADSCEKKALSILPFYDQDDVVGKSGIYEDYFILENILTSSMPSLKGFDIEGKPQYAKENRTSKEIDFVIAVQEGIVEYFEQYLDIMQTVCVEGNKKCAEKFLALLHKVPIKNETFQRMVYEDDFYARKINIKDLM